MFVEILKLRIIIFLSFDCWKEHQRNFNENHMRKVYLTNTKKNTQAPIGAYLPLKNKKIIEKIHGMTCDRHVMYIIL